MSAPCEHLEGLTREPMPEGGCEECLKIGSRWVHLRYCVDCGRTLCCDSSPNRHARAHAGTAGHPVVRSKEPGETWAYCFPDEAIHDLRGV